MLIKSPIVTVIPGTPGQVGREAQYTCADLPPPMLGGATDGVPSDPSLPAPDPSNPPNGTQIVLEYLDGGAELSKAPAPSGFYCSVLQGTLILSNPNDPFDTITLTNPIICAEQ
jgi:hypothetical protein